MRNLLNGKNIRDSAQETCSNVIQVAMEKINTQMSLINICVLVRKLEPEMPVAREGGAPEKSWTERLQRVLLHIIPRPQLEV